MSGFVLHDDGGDQNQGALQCQSMIGRSDFPVWTDSNQISFHLSSALSVYHIPEIGTRK